MRPKVEIEEDELLRLQHRDRMLDRLMGELREKDLVYTTCAGCGKPYYDKPEVVLDAVKGRDCGCPAGSNFAVRAPSRKRTPEEIEAWITTQLARYGVSLAWEKGHYAALKHLQAFLRTRHAKTYKCDTCHDEGVLHDTPTPGIETPCPKCG